MTRLALGLTALAALTLLAASCSGGDSGSQPVLTVYAASSLTTGFEQLAQDFEQEHDGVRVRLTFGGSSDLAAQIDQGAPADVFASADEATMAGLVAADLVDEPHDFAANTLQIAVPPGNPADVTGLADLARDDVRLVTCAPVVPCGAAAARLAEQQDLALTPVSEEQSVTDVLTKVSSGEADAGLVYVTDVAAAGDDVLGVDAEGADEVVNTYPVATVADADQPDLAQEFVDLVMSSRGREVLADLGFAAPGTSP